MEKEQNSYMTKKITCDNCKLTLEVENSQDAFKEIGGKTYCGLCVKYI